MTVSSSGSDMTFNSSYMKVDSSEMTFNSCDMTVNYSGMIVNFSYITINSSDMTISSSDSLPVNGSYFQKVRQSVTNIDSHSDKVAAKSHKSCWENYKV